MSLENLEEVYELSPAQHGMLFHTQSAPNSGVYSEQIIYTLRGDLNAAALERAFQQAVDRHPILRTSFFVEDLETPVQVVHRRVSLPLEQQDWRELAPGKQQGRLESFIHENQERGFKLSEAPLMRLTLIRVSERTYHFVSINHHAILDGWSWALLLREVFALYQACCQDQSIYLEASRPYGDYIGWLRQRNLSEAERYWRQALKGFTAPIILGIDQAPNSVPSQEDVYKELEFQWSVERTEAFQSFARKNHLTLSTIVHGVWALLLSRYSAEEDVVFGTIVSGRSADLSGFDSMVGLFINTLPVRVKVPYDDTALRWFKSLQRQLVELRQYEYSPLVEVQGWSEVRRDQPLFESILVFENYPTDGSRKWGGTLSIDHVRFVQRTNYPLTLLVMPGESLSARIIYDCRRFGDAPIARMLGHLQSLLEGIVAIPEQRLSGLPLLTDSERHQLRVELNKTNRDYPRKALTHELFEAQVKRGPERTALRVGKTALSYAELDTLATRIAQALRSRGVGRGQRVGLCVERGAEMLAAVLGILKAGAAYVPLDPSFPQERLRFMAEDAQLALLVSTSALAGPFGLLRKRQLLLDIDAATLASQPDQRLTPDAALDVRPEDPAYVIYTSGSTGKPKGVVVPHRAVVNFLSSMAREPGLAADDVLVAVTTLSFDIAVLELQLPLTLGATVVIATRDEAIDGHALGALLEQNRATVMQATPVTWRLLLEAGWKGGKDFKALVGGEALPKDLAEQLIARGVELWNMYGPTETTVWSTCARITDTSNGISIGKPIANTTVYILDAHRNLCPIGVAGELCIGGEGVTLGYWNRPELTAERFIPDPFSTAPGAMLYRTGDRARWGNDGTLEHLGRLDFQVKIRGYRIELGEIEAGIARHPAIREVVVIAREDGPGDQRLVAYLVVENPPADLVDQLRAQLRAGLPEYMVPSAFVVLDRLPLTPNAKVDRKALPAPAVSLAGDGRSYAEPRTPAENAIAQIWSAVLGIDRVGVNDNFFDLGGHSLLLLQAHSRLRASLRPDLPFVALMQYPTVRSLARYLSGTADQSVVPAAATDRARKQREAMLRQRSIQGQR